MKAVRLEGGERLATDYVITAIHPKIALLDLLDPPLAGQARKELEAVRTSNVVQALVHVATDRLPPYEGARPEDYHGLQSFVDRQEDMAQGFIQAEAGLLPDPPASLCLYHLGNRPDPGSIRPSYGLPGLPGCSGPGRGRRLGTAAGRICGALPGGS